MRFAACARLMVAIFLRYELAESVGISGHANHACPDEPTLQQALGCPCHLPDGPCKAAHSICRGGQCMCATPATRSGNSQTCVVPCAISIALNVFSDPDIYIPYCTPDGFDLCNNPITVSGCEEPFSVSLNYFYSANVMGTTDTIAPSCQSQYLSTPGIALRRDGPRTFTFVSANQQKLIDIVSNPACRTAYPAAYPNDFQCYTAVVKDAAGKTASSQPFCADYDTFTGNYPANYPASNFNCTSVGNGDNAYINCLHAVSQQTSPITAEYAACP